MLVLQAAPRSSSSGSKAPLLPAEVRRQPVATALLSVIAAGCFVGRAAGGSCLGQIFPPLPTCFDGQSLAKTASCYKAASYGNGSDAVEAVTCRYSNKPNISDADYMLTCRAGVWQTLQSGKALPACVADSFTAWRLVNYASTSRGWWIHELKLYSDHSCHQEISAQVGTRFGNGPTGSSPDDELDDADDGNVNSFWRAPCISSNSHDLCGCRKFMGEGWSHEEKRCKVGASTSAKSEKYCAERIAAGEHDSAYDGDDHGCPAGLASFGVHLTTSSQVRCMQVMQTSNQAYSSKAIALEAWNPDKGGWTKVRAWTGLRSGVWETLRVRDGCAPFDRGSESFMEVHGHNGEAAHGDKRTIKCMGEPIIKEHTVEVECSDGRWSDTGTFYCLVPDAPSYADWLHEEAPEPEREPNPIVGLALSMGGMAIALVLIIGILHIARNYFRQRTWNRLVKYGAPIEDLEEQVRLTREVAMAMPPRAPPPLLAPISEKAKRKRQEFTNLSKEISPQKLTNGMSSAARQAGKAEMNSSPPQPTVFLAPDISKTRGNQGAKAKSLEQQASKTTVSSWSNYDDNPASTAGIGRAGPPTGTSWRPAQKQNSTDANSVGGSDLKRVGPTAGTSWRATKKANAATAAGAGTSADAVRDAISSSPKLVRGPKLFSGERQRLEDGPSQSSGFWNPPQRIGRGADWAPAGGSTENLPL